MGWEERLAPFLGDRSGWVSGLLGRLIGFRSLSGSEAEIQAFLLETLSRAGLAAKAVAVEETIVDDPDHTPLPEPRSYRDRPNILVAVPGTGGGRSALLNTHTDVVPAPARMFEATVDDGVVRGRGACDAKGQVVTLVLALRAMRELGLELAGDVEAQFVVEEEAGGNGSLALLAAGRKAEAAVVLEPTGLIPRSANRGAAWFRLTVDGRSVHMGRYEEGVSACDEFAALLPVLREYEAGLRRASKGMAGFPDAPSPVVVNVGRVRAGDWPSTVPGECVAEGGIAFLSNRTAFETPAAHPAVRAFRAAAEEVLGTRQVEGWNASCDARLFFHRGGMPTLVFGAGDLGHAHALDEQIRLDDIVRAAEVLVRFLVRWCGLWRKEP
jgi:acetylornithine deacetylase